MNWSIELLWVPVLLSVFLSVHELGHIAAAKLLQLRLQKVGFRQFPLPHVFVEIAWPRSKRQRVFFLLSGFLTISFLFIVVWLFGIDYRPVYIAFGLQLLIETNPVYSDFVILGIIDKINREIARTRASYKSVYMKIYKDYLYSSRWYIHFIFWALLVIILLNLLLQ